MRVISAQAKVRTMAALFSVCCSVGAMADYLTWKERGDAGSTDAKSFDLNVAFVNCTGLDNLKKWKVESAGKIIHVVGVNATGIQVAPYSLRVLVR